MPKVKPKVIVFLPKPSPVFVFTISIHGNNQQDQKPGSRGHYLMSSYFCAPYALTYMHISTNVCTTSN